MMKFVQRVREYPVCGVQKTHTRNYKSTYSFTHLSVHSVSSMSRGDAVKQLSALQES